MRKIAIAAATAALLVTAATPAHAGFWEDFYEAVVNYPYSGWFSGDSKNGGYSDSSRYSSAGQATTDKDNTQDYQSDNGR